MAQIRLQHGDTKRVTGLSDGPTKAYTVTGAQLGATSNAYADGGLIGNLLHLGDAVKETNGYATLMGLIIQDLDNQKSKIEMIVFGSEPTNTTFTDDVALDIDDADLPKVVGRAILNAGDYQSYADNAVGVVGNIGLPVKSASVKDLWICFVSRGTPTYVADKLSAIVSLYG